MVSETQTRVFKSANLKYDNNVQQLGSEKKNLGEVKNVW